MDFKQEDAKQQPAPSPAGAALTELSKAVAWLEHEKAGLQKQVDNQVAYIHELQNERDLRRQLSKLALYIGFDGSLLVEPAYAEKDPACFGGVRATRRVRREHLQAIQPGDLTARPFLPAYRTEWRLVFETAKYYVYEQIA